VGGCANNDGIAIGKIRWCTRGTVKDNIKFGGNHFTDTSSVTEE
jgi:hypothetical protein